MPRYTVKIIVNSAPCEINATFGSDKKPTKDEAMEILAHGQPEQVTVGIPEGSKPLLKDLLADKTKLQMIDIRPIVNPVAPPVDAETEDAGAEDASAR